MAEGMRSRALLLAGAALPLATLALTACDNEQTTSRTRAATTTVSSTTMPDPAAAACSRIGDDPTAVDDLRTSQDARIAQAARDLDEADDPFDGEIDGELARAVEELVRACQSAGYIPP
jgi:hypothetical protein